MAADFTCPVCHQSFRLRRRGRCPHCDTDLVIGSRNGQRGNHEYQNALVLGRPFWWFNTDAGTWSFVKARSEVVGT